MKRFLLVIGLCWFASIGYGQNYQIQRSTISAGGGTTESASYRISTSIGDPGTNVTSSASYQLKIGMYPIGFNQPPTDITLGSLTIDENQVVGTSVGTLTTADPEINDTHTYTLVAGVGDTDNASFFISADALKSAVVFDFEAKDTYSIRLQTDDGDGGTFQKEFTITIININDAPTDLTISAAPAVDENLPAGQILGTFISSTDQDIASAADTHTYSLPAGQLDNDLFLITGVSLSTNSSFDFETQPTLTIKVRTTDSGGAFFEKDIVVTINDANDPPTGFDGTNLSYPDFIFPENLPVGTLIATLSSIDEDAVDTYTYSLVAGVGDADNSYFQIVGSEVQILNNLDFERVEGSTFHVRLQTQDFAGAIYSDSVSINITNVDEAPTAVDFVGASPPDILNISEDMGSGSPIAFLAAVDEDAADVYDPGNLRHTYELTAGVIDNSTFSIDGNLLKTAATLNFAIKSIYNIIVRVTDLDDPALQYDQTLRVNVVESGAIINSNPIGLSLSNTTLLDNALPDDITGTITSTDPDDTDGTDAYTYALVAGTGDTGNTSFLISGDQLLLNTTLDALVQNTYSVRIRTTDASGGAYDQVFIINIIDFVNTPPTEIALSNDTVIETAATGTVVGTLSATDGDAHEAFTYALVAGTGDTGNASFSIVGNELQTNASYDFLVQNTYSIRVQVTDNYGGTFEKVLAVNILDTRPPLLASLSPTTGALSVDKAGDLTIIFNEPVNVGVADITIYELLTDNLVESITASSGSVTGTGTNTITIDPVNNFNGAVAYYITIESATFSDLAGNIFAGWLDNASWAFTTVNTLPSDINLSAASVDETVTIGTTVGTLTATDVDPNQTFTYLLVAGTGDTDNASFSIVGDELQTNASYDFLVQDNYSIRVQVTDNFGGIFEKEHTISILDTRAPLISSLDPSLGALEIDNARTLFITFNELVNTGTGNIIIYEKQTDNLIETISVTSANVTGSGSLSINIDPTSDFIGGIEYYVTIEIGAFIDIAGNAFSGWTDDTMWSFTTIDNVAPVISFVPTPATYLTQGGSTDVAVTITDESAVIVYFHSGGIMPSSSISASQIELASGAYTASITDAAFDAVGLQYFFTATDGNGNTASSDTLFMYLSLTVDESIAGLKFGGKIEDYQIIAFPYLLNNNKIIDVFSNFGSYDKTKWRILHYNGSSGAYDDFPEFTTVEMGKGYWFNAVDQAEVTLSTRDYPQVNNRDGYSLTLSQGWNQIGNPFTVDLDWDQVLTNNNISEGVEIEALWVYEAGPSLTLGNKLKAYRGGFVKANQIINLKLFPGTMNSGGRIVDDEILANNLEEEAWVFPFTLKKAQYQYNAGYIGMHPEAIEGKDRYDLSAAPRFIKHLDYHFTSVSTTDQQTGQVVKLADSYEWEFIVNTNLEPGIASIHWPTEKIGNNTLLLFDTETQRLVNMSDENKYEFNLSGQRKFKVLFNVPNEDILPDKTLMGDPYPNPTNNITYIPLTVAESKSQEVEMKVYSLVGNEVASIYQGELGNGFHKLKWDANDHTGNKVQSGIYVIRLIVRDNDQYKTFIKRVLIN